VLFSVVYAGYLFLGGLIVFKAGSIPIDTWARVGNAYYALYSRDPHLGAIGFVLPPVPTLAILPLLPFKAFFPALATSAFAASITSAAFMAGAVVLLRRILNDLAVAPRLTWLLVALFALHPMIAYYGANGLTEAPFVFCLLWATSSFLRWLDRGGLADLVRLAMGLAIGYLTRYEFIAAAPLAIAAVALVSYLRAEGSRSNRRVTAAADAVIAGLPFAMAFVGWAFVSWLLVGSPFSQFTSIYGNSSQVRLLHDTLIEQTGQGTTAALGYVGAQVLGLAPLLPVIGFAALIAGFFRLDQRVLAPVAIIGGPVAFSVVAFLAGSTVGFLRYEIAVIPLLLVLAGTLVAGRNPSVGFTAKASWTAALDRGRRRAREVVRSARDALGARLAANATVARWRDRLPWAGRTHLELGAAIVIGIALSLPTGVATMRHPLLAREEADALRSTLGNAPPSTDASYVLATHMAAGRVAGDIDRLGLYRGAVLLDVAVGNAVVLQSAHPDWFVITPDRDFERILADPATFGVRYLLVSNNPLDAVNRAYPGLYTSGLGFATLTGEYDVPGSPGWRLYRLDAVP
jgi:4-amino-4-deoxy-L-arabinose transferase-like glycosyltransferase